MNILFKLANIANEFDEKGFFREADDITNVMNKIAQQNLNKITLKQNFNYKYNLFKQLIDDIQNKNIQSDNQNQIKQLYNELMLIASNYLNEDQDVFNAMKWVVTTYKGIFN
jgi:hypothetical protein